MISRTVLIASCDFGARLNATRAAAAIARGLAAAGAPATNGRTAREPATDGLAADKLAAGGLVQPDVCALAAAGSAEDPRVLLDGLDFDARMRRARAVVVADRCLDPHTLNGSVVFEIATRARQGGVPAYAITGTNALSAFDARILDLQVILEARSERALEAAGRRLAELV